MIIYRHVICLAAAMLLFVSCAGAPVADSDSSRDELQAENILLKNRADMLARENAVLKNENLRLRSESTEQSARIEKLESDMAAMETNHGNERALMESRIRSLEEKLEILNRESSGRISELIAQGRENESRLTAEISRMNDALLKQQQESSGRLENLKSEFTRKEYVYMKTIEEMNRDAASREARIKELAAANETMSRDVRIQGTRLEETARELDALRTRCAVAEASLAETRGECRRLRDERDSLLREIEELRRRSSQVRTDPPSSEETPPRSAQPGN